MYGNYINPLFFSSFPLFDSIMVTCWDGSQDSKLPLHASHVALPI